MEHPNGQADDGPVYDGARTGMPLDAVSRGGNSIRGSLAAGEPVGQLGRFQPAPGIVDGRVPCRRRRRFVSSRAG